MLVKLLLYYIPCTRGAKVLYSDLNKYTGHHKFKVLKIKLLTFFNTNKRLSGRWFSKKIQKIVLKPFLWCFKKLCFGKNPEIKHFSRQFWYQATFKKVFWTFRYSAICIESNPVHLFFATNNFYKKLQRFGNKKMFFCKGYSKCIWKITNKDFLSFSILTPSIR